MDRTHEPGCDANHTERQRCTGIERLAVGCRLCGRVKAASAQHCDRCGVNLFQTDRQVAPRPFQLPAVRVLILTELLPIAFFLGSATLFVAAFATESDLMLFGSFLLAFGFFVGGVGWLMAGRGDIAISMCALQLTLVSLTAVALIFAFFPDCGSSGCVGSGSDDEWRPLRAWVPYFILLIASCAVSTFLLTRYVQRPRLQSHVIPADAPIA